MSEIIENTNSSIDQKRKQELCFINNPDSIECIKNNNQEKWEILLDTRDKLDNLLFSFNTPNDNLSEKWTDDWFSFWLWGNFEYKWVYWSAMLKSYTKKPDYINMDSWNIYNTREEWEDYKRNNTYERASRVDVLDIKWWLKGTIVSNDKIEINWNAWLWIELRWDYDWQKIQNKWHDMIWANYHVEAPYDPNEYWAFIESWINIKRKLWNILYLWAKAELRAWFLTSKVWWEVYWWVQFGRVNMYIWRWIDKYDWLSWTIKYGTPESAYTTYWLSIPVSKNNNIWISYKENDNDWKWSWSYATWKVSWKYSF